MIRRAVLCLLAVALAAGTVCAAEVAFELVDEWTVQGVETARPRPIRLTPTAPEGLQIAPNVMGTARYGALPVGAEEDVALPVLLDHREGTSTLYLDANNDGTIGIDESCEVVEPDTWQIGLVPPGQEAARTVRFKLAAGGHILLASARGCRRGTLPTPDGLRTVLLLDGNGDLAYTMDGCDQLCCDLNDDGRFDAAGERVALRTTIHLGGEEWQVEVSPSGDSVSIDLRDRQPGTLLPTVDAGDATVDSALLTLVRDDGLPLAIRNVGEQIELPEGSYRIAGADLKLIDEAGVRWRYPFSGTGRGETIEVRAGEVTEAELVTPLKCTLTINGTLGESDFIRVRVNILTPEGLRLGAAARNGEVIAAKAWLIGPQGKVLASDDAGFG
jgi:hypothetical protein